MGGVVGLLARVQAQVEAEAKAAALLHTWISELLAERGRL